MPRDLFGDVTHPAISIGNRKWYTVPLSLFTHSLAIGLLIALPLLAPAVMPAVLADDDPEWITITPPTPPPRPRSIEPVKPVEHLNAIPLTAPEGISPEKPRIEAGFENDHAGPGFVDGVFDSSALIAPPPLPEVSHKPIRVGGTVRQPQKVRDVKPVYPQLALISRVEGVVIIEPRSAPMGAL